MALLTRSSVMFAKKETIEGTLEPITSGDSALSLRDGFSLGSESDTIDTDELINDIGASKKIVVGENPSASYPGYTRASGSEGVEPEYGVLIESCLGDKTVNTTEYSTAVGSTTEKVAVADGSNFENGQALLVKDSSNGWSIRNVDSIDTNDLNLNFDLANAPADAIDLGKAVLYKPAASNHPTFSLYRHQAGTGSAYKDAISGCRTTSFGFEYPARDLATFTAEIEGLNYFWNYLTIDSSNNKIDFTDSSSTVVATLENKTYKTPLDLASEISSKMSGASVDVVTCEYSSVNGKFTIASDGTTLELLFNTGANVANTVAGTIGFITTADKTGALSYESDNAQTYDPSFSPIFDDQDPVVVKNAELLLGDSENITCRKATNVSVNVSAPKENVDTICAETGRSETLILEREVTLSATLILQKYEAEIFDRAINNTTTKLMMNVGPKSGDGNWIPGKCQNVFFQSASIVGSTVQDESGYQVIQLECSGFISSSTKDIYINYV